MEAFKCPECNKKSIVVVKAAFLCLGHTLIIAIARVKVYRNYKLYKNG